MGKGQSAAISEILAGVGVGAVVKVGLGMAVAFGLGLGLAVAVGLGVAERVGACVALGVRVSSGCVQAACRLRAGYEQQGRSCQNIKPPSASHHGFLRLARLPLQGKLFRRESGDTGPVESILAFSISAHP